MVKLDIKCWRGKIGGRIGWLSPGDIFVLIHREDGWLYGLTKFGAVYTFNNAGCFHK